jgi:hypothetical protein
MLMDMLSTQQDVTLAGFIAVRQPRLTPYELAHILGYNRYIGQKAFEMFQNTASVRMVAYGGWIVGTSGLAFTELLDATPDRHPWSRVMDNPHLKNAHVALLVSDETTGAASFSYLHKGRIKREITCTTDQTLIESGKPLPAESLCHPGLRRDEQLVDLFFEAILDVPTDLMMATLYYGDLHTYTLQ